MFFKNTVEVNIQGEHIERFLNICSHHNIKLYNVIIKENECSLKLHAADFFLIKNMIKKSNVKVKIIRKQGISFFIKKYAKRKMFLIASFFCLLLLWIGSHFLWGIRTEGNHTITNDMITEFLQQQGIYYGMPLSKIPIYELKTNLRNSYDEITWVSIYLEGTNLHISLKENDTVPQKNTLNPSAANLIAEQEGIVADIVVRQGTAMVKAGDEIKQGDVLISGKIEIPADDGTIKETKYCIADGDVHIIYDYPINETQAFEYLTKEYTGSTVTQIDLYLNHKPLKIPHFKIPYIKYDSVTENLEYPLFDLLSLPIKIKKNQYRQYYIIRKKYTSSEAETLLNEKLDKIFLSLEEKGVQIIEKNVKIRTNSVYLSAVGSLKIKSQCSKLQVMEEIK